MPLLRLCRHPRRAACRLWGACKPPQRRVALRGGTRPHRLHLGGQPHRRRPAGGAYLPELLALGRGARPRGPQPPLQPAQPERRAAAGRKRRDQPHPRSACADGRRALRIRAAGNQPGQPGEVQLDAPGDSAGRRGVLCPRRRLDEPLRAGASTLAAESRHGGDGLRPGQRGQRHELRGDVRRGRWQRRRPMGAGVLACSGRVPGGADAQPDRLVGVAERCALRPQRLRAGDRA